MANVLSRTKLLHLFVATLSFPCIGCSAESNLEFAESFKNVDRIAASIRNAGAFKTYEGLPHNYWESELYEKELKSAKTIEIVGSPFYAEPVLVSDEFAAKLVNLIGNRASLAAFGGPKACGGFHPDWCLVWQDAQKTYSAMICLGCSELKVHADGELVLYCDIRDGKFARELLDPLRTNRPPEKFDEDFHGR